MILKEVKENNGKCYLAIDENRAIGLIMGVERKYTEEDYLDYKCPKAGIITELIVSKEYRKSKLGEALINKLEGYFKSLGCEYIYVDVFDYNENAIEFYKKYNYHSRMTTMIKRVD